MATKIAAEGSEILLRPAANAAALSVPNPAPNWLFAKAPIERSEKPIQPSKALSPSLRQGESSELKAEKRRSLRNGTLAHSLLQFLPHVSSESRESAALNF